MTLAHVRTNVLANLLNVDENLAARVADGLGIDLPPPAVPAVAPKDMKLSPALRLIDKYAATLTGRSIGLLLSDGVDAKLVNELQALLKTAGADCKLLAEKIGGRRDARRGSVGAVRCSGDDPHQRGSRPVT